MCIILLLDEYVSTRACLEITIISRVYLKINIPTIQNTSPSPCRIPLFDIIPVYWPELVGDRTVLCWCWGWGVAGGTLADPVIQVIIEYTAPIVIN